MISQIGFCWEMKLSDSIKPWRVYVKMWVFCIPAKLDIARHWSSKQQWPARLHLSKGRQKEAERRSLYFRQRPSSLEWSYFRLVRCRAASVRANQFSSGCDRGGSRFGQSFETYSLNSRLTAENIQRIETQINNLQTNVFRSPLSFRLDGRRSPRSSFSKQRFLLFQTCPLLERLV